MRQYPERENKLYRQTKQKSNRKGRTFVDGRGGEADNNATRREKSVPGETLGAHNYSL